MKGILWFSALLAVATYIVGPVQDPDLWWHIAVGRWILAHTAVPHEDLWGLFSAGSPWRAYSWSSEVIFALAERGGGILGLLFLKITLSIAVALGISLAFSRMAGSYFIGLLLGLFCTLAAFNHFTLRPQSLIWPIFAWVVAIADGVSKDRLTKSRALGLVFLFMLWANTHLSAALGLGTAVLWAAGGSTAAWGSRVQKAFAIGAVCIIGTLITPYAGGEWITFFGKTSHPLRFQSVAEFQPATILQYSTAFLILAGAFAGTLYGNVSRKPHPLLLILVVVFCLGALAVVKFLPMAVIIVAALAARMWNDNAGVAVGRIGEGVIRLEAAINRIPREGLSFVCLCLAFLHCYRVWNDPLAHEVTPVQAVDFIERHALSGPILNIFGHGGYLIYRFSDEQGRPSQKVAIDGRTNLIPPHVWEAYMAAYRGRRNWRDYENLVLPETILWRTDSPLPTILIESGEWCLVHESGPEDPKLADHRAVVFVRKARWESGGLESVNCRH